MSEKEQNLDDDRWMNIMQSGGKSKKKEEQENTARIRTG
jgi:hypothetical protein